VFQLSVQAQVNVWLSLLTFQLIILHHEKLHKREILQDIKEYIHFSTFI